MGIEAARVGQYPQFGAGQGLWLAADADVLIAKRGSERPDAEHDHHSRAVAAQLGEQLPSAAGDFPGAEFAGRGGGAVDDVGDANAGFQQLALFLRRQLPRGEAGAVQGRPEAVAGAGEVLAEGGRVQAGVDADKQDVETGGDDVGYALAARGLQLRGAGAARRGRVSGACARARACRGRLRAGRFRHSAVSRRRTPVPSRQCPGRGRAGARPAARPREPRAIPVAP